MEKILQAEINSHPFVRGALCADSNGLCIAATGDILPKDSGRYVSVSRLAQDLSVDDSVPTVLIETDDSNLLIKDYDKAMVVVLKCDRDHVEE